MKPYRVRTALARAGDGSPLRHGPVAHGDQVGSAARSREVGDIPAFGGEALVVGERQVRVVTGHEAVLEHALELLDKVGTHVDVGELLQDLGHQAAGEVSIHLRLAGDDRNMTKAEPAERIVEAHAAPLRDIERVSEESAIPPAVRERGVLEPAHETGNVDLRICG